MKTVQTPTLEIAYEEDGSTGGAPVVLVHGYPDDPRVYDGVTTILVAKGYRVLRPYMRGYGATRFRRDDTPRSGQQAAFGKDLLEFLDALHIDKAALGGYDWGGRACCVVAALWPERARCLVSMGGYNIQDIAASMKPGSPEAEWRYWYQWYFQTDRGVAGLEKNNKELSRFLWKLWSPNMVFDDATFDRTAASWENPDYVAVVVHSYRHRHRHAQGDPSYADLEGLLAQKPPITVPAIAIAGEADGVEPPHPNDPRDKNFTGRFERRNLPRVGHFLARETPEEFARALLDLLETT